MIERCADWQGEPDFLVTLSRDRAWKLGVHLGMQVPLRNRLEMRISHLRESQGTHLEVTKKLFEADEGKIYGVDLISSAVLNRSLSLIQGFTTMIEMRNILCAGALLRLQVDSLMRLYACWLVENPHSLVEPLLEGKPLSTIKSKSGESLSDQYLRTELSKVYSWVDAVYKATSGFVHLSKVHMVSTVNNLDPVNLKVLLGLGDSAREVKYEDLIEAVDGFIAATECLLHLVVSWLGTKEKPTMSASP